MQAMTRRVAAFDEQMESAARDSVFWPVIEGLMALRGIKLITATTIVAEIGDLRRFATAPRLMAYLGVVPSEHSSGETKVARPYHQDRQWARAAGAGGSGVDLSPPRQKNNRLAETMPNRPRRRCKRSHGRHKCVCAVVTGDSRPAAS